MLRSIRSLLGNRVIAEDGFAGEAEDVSLNTDEWHIAELKIRIASWFQSRSVRIPGVALQRPVGATGMLPVALSKTQVKNSPLDIEPDELLGGSQDDGLVDVPLGPPPRAPSLLSWTSIVGFQTLALDGQAGVLSDVIVDDEEWHIRYLVVQLSLSEARHQTLVASDWVTGVDEESSSISLNLSIPEIKGSPEYDGRVPINRDVEGRLYDYYGQPFRHK